MRLFILGSIVLGAFLFTVEGITTIGIKEAKCTYCGSLSCLDSTICLGDCVCLKTDGQAFGQCVEISHGVKDEGFMSKIFGN